MKTLDKKLIRDLLGMRLQGVTIALVIASGVAIYLGSFSAYDSLWIAREKFYREFSFATGFASLKQAPGIVADRLSRIEGLTSLESRIVQEAIIDFPEETLPTSAKFVSLTPGINELFLTSGKLPDTDSEVVLSDSFAKANSLQPGHKLTAILSGKKTNLTVTGTALSPEFIYIFRSSNPLPDDRHYGVIWCKKSLLAAALDMESAFNDIIFNTSDNSKLPKILKEIDTILESFGGFGSFGRDKLPSYSFLRDEFKQLRTTAIMIPAIFLGVAAFLLHIFSSRLISREREQIAALKAIGYRNNEVAFHYLKLIFLVSLAGSVIGILLGYWMGGAMTGLYSNFYKFPDLSFRFGGYLYIHGVIIGVGSGLLGAFSSIRKAINLQPAAAMRPPVPEVFSKSLLEKFGSIRDIKIRIIIRNLSKKPFRTLLASFGISSAVMIMVIGSFSTDAVQKMLYVQFNILQRESLSLSFLAPVHSASLNRFLIDKRVLSAEGYRISPIRIHNGLKTKEIAVFGLPADAKLRRVVSPDGIILTPPDGGIFLNSQAAEKLDLKNGDTAEIELLDGRKKKFKVVIEKLIDEMLGMGAYMERSSLNRLLGEGDLINFIALQTDPAGEESLVAELKYFPKIAGVTTRKSILKSFHDTMARSVLATEIILLLFAAVIAVGVVYNSAMISLAERAFELGSLRILGLTKNEVFQILSGEILVEMAFAYPIGCVLGFLFSYLMMQTVQTEGFKIPLEISAQTYLISLLTTTLAAIFSFYIVFRKIKTMDLISILKVRE